jgi:hypothetical protein
MEVITSQHFIFAKAARLIMQQREHTQSQKVNTPRFSACLNRQKPAEFCDKAGVAQLVEHELPKLGVAGSNPVARSNF